MFCKYCGSQLDEDALFCDHCGKTVKKSAQEDSSDATFGTEKKPDNTEAGENSSEKTDSNRGSGKNETTETGGQTGAKGQSEPSEEAGKEENVSRSWETQTEDVVSEELAPKKSKKGVYVGIALAVVVVIVVIVVLLVTGVLGPKHITEESNLYQEMNFNNGGHFAYDESRLYFAAPYGNDASDASDISLYSTDYNGVNKQMILKNSDVSRFRVVNDRIYYELDGGDNYTIGSINKDGTDNTTIVSMGSCCFHYDVYMENLYYLENSELHCCSLDGTDNIILLDDVSSFTQCGGVIYYVDEDDVVSSYQLREGSSEQICKAPGADSLAVDGDTLYFSCDTGLSSVPLTEESSAITKIVRDDALSSYVFYDDSIYYLRALTADLTYDETVELGADLLDYLLDSIDYDADKLDSYATFIAYLIFCYGYIYQAPATGGEGYEADFDDSLAFCLYTYPEGIYCWSQVLSYDITPLEIKE